MKSSPQDASPVVDIAAGRRAFLKSLGLAAGLAAITGAGFPDAARAQAVSDADILNFALNLEYLEAEFYLRAAFGRGLADADTTGTGDPGFVIGGRKVRFRANAIRLYAEEIANDEETHVKFLRGALGSAAVARPRIDLRNSFTAAARAAGLIGPTATFDAFANENNFLLAAKGAARLIDNKDILEAAAGLLAVEAYHAGNIRTILYARELFAANAISNARDDLDGPTALDQGIGSRDRANIVPTDRNGLAFSRNTSQVLSIVYLGGDAKGGFFPRGVNGAIASA